MVYGRLRPSTVVSVCQRLSPALRSQSVIYLRHDPCSPQGALHDTAIGCNTQLRHICNTDCTQCASQLSSLPEPLIPRSASRHRLHFITYWMVLSVEKLRMLRHLAATTSCRCKRLGCIDTQPLTGTRGCDT
jgi:hypothetical protein